MKISKKWFSFESAFLYIHFFCLLMITLGVSRLSDKTISLVHLFFFVFYVLVFAKLKYFTCSKFASVFMIFTILIIISSFGLNTAAYNCSKPELFAYSLIGVQAYFFNYIFTKRNPDKKKVFLVFYLFFFIGAILANLYFHLIVRGRLDLAETEATNVMYYIIAPLPFLFYFRKVKLTLVVYAIAFILVVLSYKRSGIIIIGIIGFFLVFFNPAFANKSFSKKSFYFLLSALAIYILIRITGENNIAYVLERLENAENDKGSGRLYIWQLQMDYLPKMDIQEWILGHGFGTFTYRFSRFNMAHNDYVETFYSYGLIAPITLLILVIKMIKLAISQYKNPIRLSFYAFCTAFFVFNMVSSCFFCYTFTLPLFAFLGFFDAQNSMKKISYKKQYVKRFNKPLTNKRV